MSSEEPRPTETTNEAAPQEPQEVSNSTSEAPKSDEPISQTAEAKPTTETPEIGRPRRSTQIGEPKTLEAPPFTPSSGPVWPEIDSSHPLFKLESELKSILDEAKYDEVYGIKLDLSGEFHNKLILQKFLRANANSIENAKKQLLETLKWRKMFQPLKCVEEVHSRTRFEGLGYVTELEDIPNSPNEKDVVTFNIYGAVKDHKLTFGDLDGFLRWRVGLMELGIEKLGLKTAKEPIPDYGKGPDPYQGVQVHDYLNVSFLRQDPNTKAATKKTVDVFKLYYPETLSRKFFVNVPRIMGWVFEGLKLVLSKETVQKFTVLTYGKDLAGELGQGVPEEYGGKGGSLQSIGQTMKTEGPSEAVGGEVKSPKATESKEGADGEVKNEKIDGVKDEQAEEPKEVPEANPAETKHGDAKSDAK
ncbi:MAG: Non-classical phosphatidylinositol transfer protein (PITP) [Bogoriella megaspora]|nr:MAG: Non-classical phosphatidylinositol transfer protein (PITP) [Bogoriella megaspora]